MRRLLVLLLLLILAAASVWLSHGVGWEMLARNQADLQHWVQAHPLLAGVSYIAVYLLTTALSLPHGALLTVGGGLLFGPVVATVLTDIGATAGVVVLVVVLRTLLAGTLQRQQQRIPEAMRMRLARDGMSYLLLVRLLPIFPFWLVNIAIAVSGMRLTVVVLGTLIGILPVTYILASIGSGIGAVLAQGQTPDLSMIFAPHILLPLAALALLSMLPVMLRWRNRRA